ncbi:hypothetical protein EYC80_000503 [Monilinia laxa]|uniref:Uncharacterized protein n=1 Tax=Monilinia laxa TaxID=61186 RepID=A0A5N6KC03_MONLA|nr:hypothetical protein EYC80_000503 [Monilinia laxa]
MRDKCIHYIGRVLPGKKGGSGEADRHWGLIRMFDLMKWTKRKIYVNFEGEVEIPNCCPFISIRRPTSNKRSVALFQEPLNDIGNDRAGNLHRLTSYFC